jgi:hypothetical protein
MPKSCCYGGRWNDFGRSGRRRYGLESMFATSGDVKRATSNVPNYSWGSLVGTSSYADVARRAGEMMASQSNKEHVRVSKKM